MPVAKLLLSYRLLIRQRLFRAMHPILIVLVIIITIVTLGHGKLVGHLRYTMMVLSGLSPMELVILGHTRETPLMRRCSHPMADPIAEQAPSRWWQLRSK